MFSSYQWNEINYEDDKNSEVKKYIDPFLKASSVFLLNLWKAGSQMLKGYTKNLHPITSGYKIESCAEILIRLLDGSESTNQTAIASTDLSAADSRNV